MRQYKVVMNGFDCISERLEALMGSEAELDTRLAALICRLELEELANRYLSLAHAYIETDEKIGWQPAKILQFLIEEIDPQALSPRTLSVSSDVPSSPAPNAAEYESFTWHDLGTTADIDVRTLKSHWQKMSGHLHFSSRDFDRDAAIRQIHSAIGFLRRSNGPLIFIKGDPSIVKAECGGGHISTRLRSRLKAGKVFSCSDPSCKRCFRVENIEGTLTPLEVMLHMNCRHCGNKVDLPAKEFTELTYWQKATFSCPSCRQENEVQWLLSGRTV